MCLCQRHIFDCTSWLFLEVKKNKSVIRKSIHKINELCLLKNCTSIAYKKNNSKSCTKSIIQKSHFSCRFLTSQSSYNSHLSETTFKIVFFLPVMHWPLHFNLTEASLMRANSFQWPVSSAFKWLLCKGLGLTKLKVLTKSTVSTLAWGCVGEDDTLFEFLLIWCVIRLVEFRPTANKIEYQIRNPNLIHLRNKL